MPLILLQYCQEDQLDEDTHHRFMPWWAIVWLPLLVTFTTMAFSPNSFHYMILYVMCDEAREADKQLSDPYEIIERSIYIVRRGTRARARALTG